MNYASAGTSSQELVKVFDRERDLVSLELHDNVLQTMASALQHVQAALQNSQAAGDARKNLLAALRLMRQSMDAARGIMGELRPPVLDRAGLVETLRMELMQIRDERGWRVSFEAGGGAVPRDMELPLYRVMREAVTNALKHSGSPSLYVSLHVRREPPEVAAQVRDEGRGFDAAAVPSERMGLVSMQVRAKLLGGDCRIQTAPGSGTTVSVRLPLPKEQAVATV